MYNDPTQTSRKRYCAVNDDDDNMYACIVYIQMKVKTISDKKFYWNAVDNRNISLIPISKGVANPKRQSTKKD